MYKNILEIDVGRCINALLNKRKFIAVFALLFFIIGLGLTLDKGVDEYTARATVYASADGSYEDATTAVTAMNAYMNVAVSYKVCQRAALLMGRGDVDPSYIQSAVKVTSSQNKSSSSNNFVNQSATIITFAATTTDPDLSKQMADAMAQSFALEMAGILDKNSVKVLDNAYSAPKTFNAVLHAWTVRVVAAIIGCILACCIIVIFEIFDTKVRTVRDASVRDQIPVLGIIPDFTDREG
ncbi:MAG: hypothetical protein K5871_06610 [Lachnospiraceae bacterium]|nr:hypothetical protein [Lachnospiraceae bacterium]